MKGEADIKFNFNLFFINTFSYFKLTLYPYSFKETSLHNSANSSTVNELPEEILSIFFSKLKFIDL